MTSEEKYQLEFAKGKRIGMIGVSRKLLINTINKNSKKESFKPNRDLFQKVNREIDLPFLRKIFFLLLLDKITVKGLEENYDTIFLTEDEIHNKTYN